MAKKTSKKKSGSGAAKRSSAPKATQGLALPALGKNEIQRGIAFNDAGKPLYHLIEILGEHGSATHAGALAIAKEKGAQLANLVDGRLLGAVDKRGGSGAFWLEPQYEAYGGFAWAQGFDDGYQGGCHEDGGFRVRLVRKIVI